MKNYLFPLLLFLSLSMSAVAYADIGKKQATSIAQSVHPGRVLSVKQESAGDVPVYRVKTLSAGGDVHVIVIDAETGKVISK